MGFYGLEIAKSGLFASQAGLEVVGHNIANSATNGYTRQRIELQSISPAAWSARFSKITAGAVGGGVSIQSIKQVRNSYVDRELRREYSDMGRWQTQTEAMTYIESMFNEKSDYSISSAMADFFNSLSELSTDASSMEIRTDVQQNAIQLTSTFNHYYKQLTELQDEQNESMYSIVQEINNTLERIASYNQQIFSYELSGEYANDLRDKRNTLLDDLSKMVNIDYSEGTDGTLTVSVEGQTLVDHTTVNKLQAVAGGDPQNPDFYNVLYNGATFKYSSGSLEAYRSMRDGNDADDFGIPRLLDNLNKMCRNIAEAFNEIHRIGYTLATPTTESISGVNFFAVPTDGYEGITAGNFSLSDEILADVHNIAASSKPVDLSKANTQEGNNENLLDLVALSTSEKIGVFTDMATSTLDDVTGVVGFTISGAAAGETFTIGNNGTDLTITRTSDGKVVTLTGGAPAAGAGTVEVEEFGITIRLDSDYAGGTALAGTIRMNATSDEIGNFEDFFKSVLSELAISSRYSNSMFESQQSVVGNLETRKEAVSGVSINEEMIEMIKYQHAYSAASRMITAIDEALDTLINKTGIVGR